MDLDELRLGRLSCQHLLSPSEKLTAVRDLCGVQAQFFGNAVHSLKIRCNDLDTGGFGDGLVKSWTLRGTMHVFAASDMPLFIRPELYRNRDWTLPDFWNSRPDWALTPERQEYFADAILSALSAGSLSREELKNICRREGMTDGEEGSMFHPWGGGIRELAERGFIVYEAGEEKVFRLAPEFESMPERDARLELARRYFTHMAPATIRDASCFFGVPQRQVKEWLNALPVKSSECGGRTYYFIENRPADNVSLPRCIFLAGFDQLMLAYDKRESPFLREDDIRSVFSLSGIIHPTVLLDGQVSGRWKKRGKSLTVLPFRTIDRRTRDFLADAAFRLWGGETTLSFEQ